MSINRVQPAIGSDDDFLDRTEKMIQKPSFVVLDSRGHTLVDIKGFPIFRIEEANTSLLSREQQEEAKVYLAESADIIRRLLRIVKKVKDTIDEHKEK